MPATEGHMFCKLFVQSLITPGWPGCCLTLVFWHAAARYERGARPLARGREPVEGVLGHQRPVAGVWRFLSKQVSRRLRVSNQTCYARGMCSHDKTLYKLGWRLFGKYLHALTAGFISLLSIRQLV